ncbi:MAG: SRPBCC domain-containing protein [Silicimonas sp.]|nr:SRPBCC domain-containing protein [Silicimonas sp.]
MPEPKFEMTRHFDAPQDLVWRCWTEADLVQRWYGPGVETEIHAFEPRPGGLWKHEMRMGERSLYQRIEFIEVEAPDRLVMLMASADDRWAVTPSPVMPLWPPVMLTQVTLAEAGGGTDLTLIWTPHEASAQESIAFAEALPQMEGGWAAGMDVIAEILRELQG